MAPDIRMNPDPVGTAGAELDLLANNALANTDGLLDSSEAAAAGHEGWLSAPALRTCGQAWHRRLDDLVEQTRQAGRNLTDSATTTSTTDLEAADRLHEVLFDMSGSRAAARGQHGESGDEGKQDVAGS
jgi:hypothetical protein